MTQPRYKRAGQSHSPGNSSVWPIPLLQKCCRAGSHPGASITITYGVLSNRALETVIQFTRTRVWVYEFQKSSQVILGASLAERLLQGYLGWFHTFILGCTTLIRLLWLYYEFLYLLGVVTTLETFLDIFFCYYASTLVVLKLSPGECEKKPKVASPL